MSTTLIRLETPQQQRERLIKLGFAVNEQVPGYSLTDTLARFQAANSLITDGEYGPMTQNALFGAGTANGSLTQRMLTVASAMVGVSEVPAGSNKGPQIDLLLASVGLSGGNSWCMAYVYWVIREACRQLNIKNPFPKTGHCMTAWEMAGKMGLKRITAAEARKNPSLVQPGMVAIWLIAPLTGAGHTGIVRGTVQGVNFPTYEGNSNINGEREGLEVARQTKRKLTDKILVGFIVI